MRSTLIPLAVILSSIFFVSCQREVDERLTDITSGDTVKIKTVAFIDTTIASGNDTSEVNYYFYDNKGRIEHDISRTIIDPILNTWQTNYDYFSYNGNETLPYKIASYDDQNFIYDTSYYTYDADGFLIKDSTVEVDNSAGYTGHSVGTYQSAAGGGYVYLLKLNNNGSGFVTIDSVKYWTVYSGGNLLNEIDSAYGYATNFGLSTVFYYTMSYDTYQNPYSIAGFLVTKGGGEFANGDMAVVSVYKNNRLHFQTYSTDVLTGWTETPKTETVVYNYRADGYPVSGIASGNWPDYNKVIYTYY